MVRESNQKILLSKEKLIKTSIRYHAVLFLGLLFIVFITVYYWTYREERLREDKEHIRMGQLFETNPNMESTIIQVFHNNLNLDSKKLEGYRTSGLQLDEKYGYGKKVNTDSKSFFEHFNILIPSLVPFIILLLIFTITFYVISYIVHQRIYKSHYVRLYEILGVLDDMHQGNYEVEHFQQYNNDKNDNIIIQRILDQLIEIGASIQTMKDKILDEKYNVECLITNISHQLKTPLSSLKMSYEILEEDSFTEEEKIDFLIRGREEVEKLNFLTETLTKLSRLETGMIYLKKEESNLIETLKRAVGSVIHKAIRKKISISLMEWEDSKGCVIPHDGKWTEEAFVNVLDNAIKYSKNETKITIKITLMVSYVVVEIMDEGIGIAKEDYNRIFTRFYRGDAKEVKETEGAGVGLYLVRYILEEQGGSIRVKENKPNGSNFLITLPKI